MRNENQRGSAPRAPYDVELKPPGIDQPAGDNNLLTQVGRLQPGARETRSFVLPKLAAMKVILLGGKAWSFRTPSGEVIVPGKTKNLVDYDSTANSLGFTGFFLESPEPGAWTVTAEASQADTAFEYGVLIEPDGPAEEVAHLETMLRDSDPSFSFLARPGDPVYVRAFVARNGQAVPGINWEVRAFTSLDDSLMAIPVFDDGRHADGKADDGVSVGAIVAEGPDGHYRLIAKGRMPNGVEYSVQAGIEVQAKNDLLIADSIAVSPRNPKVGEPVTLTVTAMNDGTAGFKDAELYLYIDRNKLSEQKLDLRPGESRRVMATWVPTEPGDHVVQLTLGSYDEPYASDLTNNTRRTIVRVK